MLEKLPISSLGTSYDRESSKGTKSTRSSIDRERLDDIISEITLFTTVSMKDKHDRHEEDAKYGVPMVQDLVIAISLPEPMKLKATMYFAQDKNKG